tara:strand:- start:80 stop:265 length:186 start_codon:yes stop_codon:yes gene_type:complete
MPWDDYCFDIYLNGEIIKEGLSQQDFFDYLEEAAELFYEGENPHSPSEYEYKMRKKGISPI